MACHDTSRTRHVDATIKARRVALCRDARSVRPLSNDGTCNGCRDARSVRPSPLKPTVAVTFDTTDVLPLNTSERPYNRYLSDSSDPSDTSDSSDQRNHPFPREGFLNLQGGKREFFETLISFFRSFISFFRSFISRLRGEFPFAPWGFPISSVEVGIIRDAGVAIKWLYSTV